MTPVTGYIKQNCWIVATIEPDSQVVGVYLSERQAKRRAAEGLLHPGNTYPEDLCVTEAPLMHNFETRLVVVGPEWTA